jgi:hypothetical protein
MDVDASVSASAAYDGPIGPQLPPAGLAAHPAQAAASQVEVLVGLVRPSSQALQVLTLSKVLLRCTNPTACVDPEFRKLLKTALIARYPGHFDGKGFRGLCLQAEVCV